MSTDNQFTSNFKDEGGVDVGVKFVTKSYLMEVYPYLQNTGISAPGLWIWGQNDHGQLGDNTTTTRLVPIQTISGGTNWKQVAISDSHATAIKTDGTLWVCGANAYGGLGDSTLTDRSSPVQTICGGTDWKQVSCGYGHTAAIKTDSTLWVWALNDQGQLGESTTTNRSSPVQTIAGGTTWKQVSCGWYHTAAIKTNGTLWLWGYNNVNQLGDSTTTNRSSPVQTISGSSTWKQVSCGSSHTAAIKTDGTLWNWGRDNYGQLGDSTTTNKSSPVQTICGGTDWKQVSCGRFHVAAIKTDGTLWGWGRNANAQLGDNTKTNRSSPVQTVCGGTNWKQISGANVHGAAIKTDGTLWLWGDSANGKLGISNTVAKSSPVQTIIGGVNWKQVYGGMQSTVAITEMGDDF